MTCQNMYECVYDFFLTGRREIALWTLEIMNKMFELKYKGTKRRIPSQPSKFQSTLL